MSTSSRKHRSTTSKDSYAPDPKRRHVTVRTVEKWKLDNEKTLSTATWLTYQTADGDCQCVKSTACSVCTRFNAQLKGMKNYSPAFIDGTGNLRTSSFKDHAATEMHARAMTLLKRERGVDLHEYVPITRALSVMDDASRQTMKKKFEVAFTIAKNNMAMTKMKPICELEERHGVDLGQGHRITKLVLVLSSLLH